MKDVVDNYVERLRAALRALPAHEREQIVSEVASHMAEGLEDERLGTTPAERKATLMREMGNPDELGHEMQQGKRRQRWLDFLLAVVPALFFTGIFRFVAMRLIYAVPGPPFNEIALAILPISLVMLAIARWRGSDALLLFWLLATLDNALIPLQWSVLGHPHLAFALLWSAITILTLGWLLSTLWRVRHVPLLFAFGSLPLLLQFLESAPVLSAVNTLISLPLEPGLSPAVASSLYLRAAILFLNPLLTFVALAGFFLARQRLLRWLALALFVLAPSLATSLFFGPSGEGSYLIIVLPVAVLTVVAGLVVERRNRSRRSLYV